MTGEAPVGPDVWPGDTVALATRDGYRLCGVVATVESVHPDYEWPFVLRPVDGWPRCLVAQAHSFEVVT